MANPKTKSTNATNATSVEKTRVEQELVTLDIKDIQEQIGSLVLEIVKLQKTIMQLKSQLSVDKEKK